MFESSGNSCVGEWVHTCHRTIIYFLLRRVLSLRVIITTVVAVIPTRVITIATGSPTNTGVVTPPIRIRVIPQVLDETHAEM